MPSKPNVWLLNQPNNLKLAALFYRIFARNPLVQNVVALIKNPLYAIIYARPFHIFIDH